MYMLISTLVELPDFYVPDNLKTGVSKNTRYETILNKSNGAAERKGDVF